VEAPKNVRYNIHKPYLMGYIAYINPLNGLYTRQKMKEYYLKLLSWFRQLKIVQTIKKLWWIAEHYDRDLGWFAHQIHEAKDMIKERTEVHADISIQEHYRDTVIVIGRYRKNDYIEIFDLHSKDFTDVVNRLKDQKKYGNIASIDAAPNVKAVLTDALKKDW